jgi:hypothetical protein
MLIINNNTQYIMDVDFTSVIKPTWTVNSHSNSLHTQRVSSNYSTNPIRYIHNLSRTSVSHSKHNGRAIHFYHSLQIKQIPLSVNLQESKYAQLSHEIRHSLKFTHKIHPTLRTITQGRSLETKWWKMERIKCYLLTIFNKVPDSGSRLQRSRTCF